MKRLGIDLGTLDNAKAPRLEASACPGALVRVTRYDYDEMTSGGERFQSARQDVPFDGYGSARVLCGGTDVEKVPKTAAGYPMWLGLCTSCSRVESKNRSDLRTREKAKAR